MSAWHGYLDEHRVRFLDELVELLRVPSVSSEPKHAADVERAAGWVADRLMRAGLEHAAVMPTGGHPVVYADWLHAPGRPTVMLYGHFDVVPPGPLDRWTSPPFEPAVRDDRLYARGTCDSKGNLLPAVQAVEALLRADGRLPVNLKVFAEGQEEIASPQLPAFIADHRHLLACDLVLNTDGGRCGADPPQLVLGARGLCAQLIEVRGPRPGLHGANYGGAVQSPLRALVHILDSLQDAHGRVRVEGFYDDVRALAPDDRALLAALPFDEAAYRARLGVTELVGEPGYTPLERVGARPHLTFSAVTAGSQGRQTSRFNPTAGSVSHEGSARRGAGIRIRRDHCGGPLGPGQHRPPLSVRRIDPPDGAEGDQRGILTDPTLKHPRRVARR